MNSQQFKNRVLETVNRKLSEADVKLKAITRELYYKVLRNVTTGYHSLGWTKRSEEYEKWRESHGYPEDIGLVLESSLLHAIMIEESEKFKGKVFVNFSEANREGVNYPLIHEQGLAGFPQRSFFQPAYLQAKWQFLRQLAEAFKTG